MNKPYSLYASHLLRAQPPRNWTPLYQFWCNGR